MSVKRPGKSLKSVRCILPNLTTCRVRKVRRGEAETVWDDWRRVRRRVRRDEKVERLDVKKSCKRDVSREERRARSERTRASAATCESVHP